ncbi:MAG: hypothetical protein ACOC8X_03570 [Chloroflexota bacterium]
MLDQANVPSVIDADIEVDVSGDNDFAVSTDIKADMTALDVSGGDFTWEQIATWAGPLVGVGPQNVDVWTLTQVYSDGETEDVWETLKDAEGQDAAIRYVPKGDTAGNRRHTLTGRLVQVTNPTPAGNQTSWQYTSIFVGTVDHEEITA